MTSKRLKTVTSINGHLVPHHAAKISVFDNSLLYAEGLFETFLACDDRVLFLKEHLGRLYRGAKVIGLKPPVSSATLARWMKMTLRAHPARIKKLRLTVTSGEAAKWVGAPGKPQVILSAAPHVMPSRPFRLQVSEFRVDQDSEFRRIKTLSYAIHAASVKQALEDGFDDALMLNQKNEIAEVTSANIIWRHGRRVYTPPLDAGCLEGVTRAAVLRGGRKLGITIVEKSESLERMLEADEVLICSSQKQVVGVSEIALGRRRYKFAPGETTQRLAYWMSRTTGISLPEAGRDR
jgi:branched-subunit amino acid aminotransferase/4-amino-4-deoxychorismate lyase